MAPSFNDEGFSQGEGARGNRFEKVAPRGSASAIALQLPLARSFEELPPPKTPRRHFLDFQGLGLLSDAGKPRLNVAQGYFRRSENEADLSLLEELYVYWRDLSEYLVLRSVHSDSRTLANVWSYVAVKCSKRGNDVYGSRVRKRLDWLGNGENVKFFDVSDFTVSNKVYSSALWVTLTYDVKRCPRFVAIENIGKEWNAFITALRQKYGKISVLRTWECSEKGYPHIHAVLLFKEAKFTVFPSIEKSAVDPVDAGGASDRTRLTFRIEEKDAVGSLWHSFSDVQAVSSTRKLFSYMRKYQTKTLLASDSQKGVRTMSLLWLFRRRGFSVSGDFRARLSDLIRVLHNSKMVRRQARLDSSLVEAPVWEFVGVFSGVELGIRGEKWTSRLKGEQIEVVLAREAQYGGVGGYGHCDEA